MRRCPSQQNTPSVAPRQLPLQGEAKFSGFHSKAHPNASHQAKLSSMSPPSPPGRGTGGGALFYRQRCRLRGQRRDPANNPLSPSDSSPSKGEQNFLIPGLLLDKRGRWVAGLGYISESPSPPGRGTGGGASLQPPPLRSHATVPIPAKHPSVAPRQLPLKGEQNFLNQHVTLTLA